MNNFPQPAPCILIADDDPTIRKVIRAVLEKQGFEVVDVDNGASAVAAFTQCSPILVLLDVVMPVLDGFQACARIRQLPGGSNVPIVIATGRDDVEAVECAYKAGATDFIAKPINWPIFGHRIRYVLRASSDYQRMQQSEATNDALLNAMPDTFMVLSQAGEILSHRPGSLEHPLPDPAEQVQALEDFFPRRVALGWKASNDAVARTGDPQRLEFAFAPQRDETYHYEARFVPYLDQNTLVLVSEITERKRAEQQIHQLAYYDSLTGLPNRPHFLERLERTIAQSQGADTSIAILCIDLDNFKRINDTLGHSFGDGVLCALADRLSGCVRSSVSESTETHGPIGVARLGGDEFVAAIEGVDDQDIISGVAERIRTKLREPVSYLGHEFVVTPSIGIAMYPDDGVDVEQLLMHADVAMYQAKGAGRDSIKSYSGTMSVRSLHRLQLETDLRQALAEDQLDLHYQPKYDIHSGELTGAEALLRWWHPVDGFISPEQFIPMAEESGLILPIGEWVLETACKQAHAWQNRFGKDLCIAVNISSQQFYQTDIRKTIMRTLFEAALKPSLLQLELTESILMRDINETISTLDYLKELGITLAIDDFGTGYSSLSYLKRFPLDFLKIDRSFVSELTTSNDDATICAAIIAMAHQLGLRVIAEGVEKQEQVEFLRSQGCDQLQGYLFSKPLPADEFETRFLCESAEIIDLRPAG